MHYQINLNKILCCIFLISFTCSCKKIENYNDLKVLDKTLKYNETFLDKLDNFEVMKNDKNDANFYLFEYSLENNLISSLYIYEKQDDKVIKYTRYNREYEIVGLDQWEEVIKEKNENIDELKHIINYYVGNIFKLLKEEESDFRDITYELNVYNKNSFYLEINSKEQINDINYDTTYTMSIRDYKLVFFKKETNYYYDNYNRYEGYRIDLKYDIEIYHPNINDYTLITSVEE